MLRGDENETGGDLLSDSVRNDDRETSEKIEGDIDLISECGFLGKYEAYSE